MFPTGDAIARLTTEEDLRRLPDLLRSMNGGPVRLHGLGRSMFPLFRSGDSIDLVSPAAPVLGSIYLAELPDGRFVTHRFVARKGDLLILRGDFNGRVDPPIPAHALVARVVRIWRGGRAIEVGGILQGGYALLQIGISPWAEPLARAGREVKNRSLALVTGPLRPVTARLAPAGPVRRLGADDMERHLILLGGAGVRFEPGQVQRLEKGLAAGTATLLGAEDGRGALVAAAEVTSLVTAGIDEEGYLLSNVWVTGLYRRRGLARSMVREAKAFGQELGANELWLDVGLDNREARTLFESEGFRRTARSSFVESRIARAGHLALSVPL